MRTAEHPQWREYLLWYLTHIAGHRQLPWVERLSYLVPVAELQDAEYHETIREWACA